MYSTTDFKKGLKIEIDGIPYEILEAQHYKPGKGGAIMRTKLSNILNGRVIDKTFRSGEKVDRADIETKTMQFLYQEEEALVFMDLSTYEQVLIPIETTREKVAFLLDAQEYKVLFWNGKAIDIDLPITVTLEVTYTEVGLKGDTVSNTLKPATLSTGITIQVPLFIEVGDMVKVDTRTKSYISRE